MKREPRSHLHPRAASLVVAAAVFGVSGEEHGHSVAWDPAIFPESRRSLSIEQHFGGASLRCANPQTSAARGADRLEGSAPRGQRQAGIQVA